MNDTTYHEWLRTDLVLMMVVGLAMVVNGIEADGIGVASLMACALIATALVVSQMYPDAVPGSVTPSLGLVPNYMGVGT